MKEMTYQDRLAAQEWEAMTHGLDLSTPEGIRALRGAIRSDPDRFQRVMLTRRYEEFLRSHRELIIRVCMDATLSDTAEDIYQSKKAGWTVKHMRSPINRELQKDLMAAVEAYDYVKHALLLTNGHNTLVTSAIHKAGGAISVLADWIDRLDLLDAPDIEGLLVPTKED